MNKDLGTKSLLNRPGAWIPLAMSLVVLAVQAMAWIMPVAAVLWMESL
jgi:hypothetical protein